MYYASQTVRVVVICGLTVLFVRSHRGWWEFPGGSIVKRESPKQAAIRETHEETGLELAQVRLISMFDMKHPHDEHVASKFFVYATRIEVSPDHLIIGDTNEIAEARFMNEQELRSLQPISWITGEILARYANLPRLYP